MTCARSASCASGTQWLVPAGPAYPELYPDSYTGSAAPGAAELSGDPQAMLHELNTDSTGCTDTAGYCNAVGVIANMLIGYDNSAIRPAIWYFALADVPGVTVKHITDAAGRADVEFRLPFADGVTGILLDAATYQFAGYVKDGTQTLLLQQANVSGPGVRP